MIINQLQTRSTAFLEKNMRMNLKEENRVNLIIKKYSKIQNAQKRINTTTTAQIHVF